MAFRDAKEIARAMKLVNSANDKAVVDYFGRLALSYYGDKTLSSPFLKFVTTEWEIEAECTQHQDEYPEMPTEC